MDGKDVIRVGLAEYWDGLRKALTGLSAAERRFQPQAHANHIDFIVWHMARDEDGEIHTFAQRTSTLWQRDARAAAARFSRNKGVGSSGRSCSESELLQGDILHPRHSDAVYPLCQEGVRHGERYHDDDQPCQPVCLRRVSAAALLLCPRAGTG